MFALSLNFQNLSPTCMKFCDYWLYDLECFHHFWKDKLQKNKNIHIAPTAWDLVLRVEKINLFSGMKELQSFAKKYHAFYHDKVGAKASEKLFSHLSRLGIQKVGQLRRLPHSQIQSRFGKVWADFFKCVLNPGISEWRWIPYGESVVLEETFDPDFELTNFQPLVFKCSEILGHWAEQKPDLCIEEMSLNLSSWDSQEDQSLSLEFRHQPLLSKNIAWISRLLEDRLQRFQFFSPLSRIRLSLKPVYHKRSIQLSLFNKEQASSLSWMELAERLKSLGFESFQPELLPSFVPETSWARKAPSQVLHLERRFSFRPLIQMKPQKITPPNSKIYFTERLAWIDVQGDHCERDYFITHAQGRWLWIFKNEKSEWFKQGVVE
ncbi:MAG: hypothetical protein COV44_11650 [Deltaproteobacteria bacterium CG11_big_fil_rev_8_21_14_0_20_45_16]|nr:MAG: hypothetical protein COV44_11650 [Deltaproteobacteria bacterium CG11_big_fil_rev_8_21_14_0_20_45_16]